MFNEEAAFKKLQSAGQEHLLSHWKQLNTQQKTNLLLQIHLLDLSLLKNLQAEVFAKKKSQPPSLAPFQSFVTAENEKDHLLGRLLIQEGKTALVVLAGGQGSRLRFEGPKGCYPISNIKKKSLYQLLAEKVKAASKLAKRPLDLALMSSPLNTRETQTFFVEHAFFGLDPQQVTFFSQQMWPFLTFDGKLFLEERDQIAYGPNGNGTVFRRLKECGIIDKWKKKGVELVQVIPIDNPLAFPFDEALFSFHTKTKNSVSMCAALRRDAQENVGVLALHNGKAEVVEYLDLSPEEKEARNQDGSLKFGIANLGIFCFSLEFMEKVSAQPLPVHQAKKAVKMLQQDGSVKIPDQPNAWKCEEFIFDVLPYAERVEALISPRDSCFAPLKNLKGEDSIDTVRAALLAFDRLIFANITGNRAPNDALFELAPQFYYPTKELSEKWRGKAFPNKDYIDE